jgi:uncharacterized protein YggE
MPAAAQVRSCNIAAYQRRLNVSGGGSVKISPDSGGKDVLVFIKAVHKRAFCRSAKVALNRVKQAAENRGMR